MIQHIARWGLVTLALVLAGCGPAQVAVKPDALNQVREIALVRVAEPPGYIAGDFGNPGVMFGAIGGVVAGVSSANAGKTVDDLARAANFKAGARLTELLRAGLIAKGYQVRVVDAAHPAPGKLLDDVSVVPAGTADTILDVAIQQIGYATEHPMFSPFWRPTAQVQVELTSRSNSQALYSEKFMYGYHNPFMSATDLDAPATYRFDNRDAMFADADKLVAGMDDAIRAVADAVVDKFQRR